MAATTNGIAKKVQRVKKSLDAIASGQYSELSFDYCCDYIAWLAKFKKVPEEVWHPLCDQAQSILDSGILLYM